MPLDVRRLRDSDLAARESPEACWAAVLLWSASWHQVPAASLPDDDMVLANLAGYGRVVKEWRKVRQGALRGWIKCSDGRLYHPVVAEKALEAWESKFKHGYAKLCERLRKENHKRKEAGQPLAVIPTFDQWKSGTYADGIPLEQVRSSAGKPEPSAGIPAENALNRTEQRSKGEVTEPNGEVRDLKPNNLNPLSEGVEKPTPSALNGKHVEPKREAKSGPAWDAYSAEYLDRYGTEPVRNASVNALLVQVVAKLGAEAPAVAAFYVRHQRRDYVQAQHPVNLLSRDAEGLRTQWATGQHVTATGALQVDRTQTNLNAWGPLIADAEERERANGKH